MKDQVTWWREVAGGHPESPLLVLAFADDGEAVSSLPSGYAANWARNPTPTSRVAAHLEVPVIAAGEELPEHDLLLIGAVGRGLTTVAASVAVHMYGAEPQLVTGYGNGLTDEQWMDKVIDVRGRTVDAVPPPVAQLTALLESSTVPVLLDGVIAAAAAANAENLPPVQTPVLGLEPVQRFLLDRANVPVWGSSGVGPGEGLGALSGLALLRLALVADEGR
jgi:hypothetical protein